jgi:acyl-CoA thioesterase I
MANFDGKPVRVTFFGDSICVGQGVSIHKGWVTRLAERLDRKFASSPGRLLFTNSSVNGRTTRQALEDMPYHIQSQGISLILIQFGLNDCNYWLTDKGNARVSLDAYIANIREMVARSRSFGAQKIILNTNHPTSRSKDVIPFTNITYEQSNRQYNQALREIIPTLGSDIIFQDVENHFNNIIKNGVMIESLLLDDGLHLSELGHDHYLELMSPNVIEAVGALMSITSAKAG